MHAFLIVSPLKEMQEIEAGKILDPFHIHPVDITIIAPQNSIGIAQARELKQKIALRPYQSEQKAVIIKDAQTLTVEAQNALLKTLEEPPDHTIIILLTTNADLLLPTILSRCQIIHLQPTTYNLQPDELSVLNSQLSVLTQGQIGQRLKLAADVAKDKEAAILWLSSMIFFVRGELLKNTDSKELLILIKSLQKTHTIMSTVNINPRFAMEILFLSL